MAVIGNRKEGIKMDDDKLLNEWLRSHDSSDYCPYCIYNDECPHGMACYGGNPVEPPCAGRDVAELLDMEALLEDIQNGEV